MKFRLETMVNTYNVRSKIYHEKGQCSNLFTLKQLNFQHLGRTKI